MLDADTLSKIGIAARAAMDKKAFDLVGLEVGDLTSYTDSFLLCSAASERQVGAIADAIVRQLKDAGSRPLHKEGAGRSDWVLLDFDDMVVHVFTEDRRAYYGLDSLWGDAPRLDETVLGIDGPADSARQQVKTRVLWFGRRGASGFDEQVEIYRRRVQQRWPAEDRVLKPVSGGRSDDPLKVLRQEARVLDRALEPGWTLVVLDEAGQRLTSEGFARFLGDCEDRSKPGLDFVIGSDLGIDREFAARASAKLSLSPMTLPHQIARLVLWEQLFRATHILGGGGYHRSDMSGC